MDELQDTNPLQWRLMGLIRREMRSSLSAMSTSPSSVSAMPSLSCSRSIVESRIGRQAIDVLRANYRSRPELLDIVNHTFAGPAPGIEAHELTSGRKISFRRMTRHGHHHHQRREHGICRTHRISMGGAPHLRVRRSLSVSRHRDSDAGKHGARRIAASAGRVRIPSLVLGGMTFYETREVRDLILLLTVLVNPRDEFALAGLLRSPLFGVR